MTTDFASYKLRIEWKPSAYHGQTVRNNLTQGLWRRIRVKVLELNNNTCSICGYTTDDPKLLRRLHVHEIEEFGEKELLCNLQGLNLICADCHSLHHYGRSMTVFKKEDIEKMKQHFMKVNNCSEDDYRNFYLNVKKKYLDDAMNGEFIDVESELDSTVLYRIDGDIPYKEEAIQQLMDKGLYRYLDDE